ncbi:UDP-xylose synthase [Russula vinacea]|nr:UDP-xylose synthase [Russula vinacea]
MASSTIQSIRTLDKSGNEITSVGFQRFGFDCEVSLDVLRSLYLRPHYVTTMNDDKTERVDAKEGNDSAPSTNGYAAYQSKSIYHPQSHSISYTTLSRFPPVKLLPSQATSVSHWVGHPNFELVRHDVVEPFMIECDQIYHLACPASPVHYQFNAVKTIKTSFQGTLNMLGLAKRTKARFLLTSTSEVYGDPEVHPQHEDYWGHVNPIGPRACYDEGKRVAETLTYGFQNQDGVDVRVARIFNTYGPRMNPFDGRVVSNFIVQALRGEDLTVYGDGSQTRSFQYIHDLVDGLIALMNSGETRPVNLGNGDEFTILEFAHLVRDVVEDVQRTDDGVASPRRVNIIHEGLPKDDPQKRRPDTSRAKASLEWQPRWTVRMGLEEMVRYYRAKMAEGSL